MTLILFAMRLLIALFALFLSVPAFAQEGPTDGDNNRVFVRLFADHDAAVPGQTMRLAVEQLIVPGWHTYWINPGDSGEPMKIEWGLPKGYQISDLLWPTPEHVPYGPLMNFGYSDRALMLADLQIPPKAQPGTTVSIRGHVSVLVCDEICIPESHDVNIDLPVAEANKPANADIFREAGRALPQPVDWQTITDADANEVRVRITLPADAKGLTTATDEIEFFPYEWGYLQNAGDQTATYDPSTRTLTLRQPRDNARDLNGFTEVSYIVKNPTSAYLVSGSIKQTGAPVMGEGFSPAVTGDISLLTVIIFALLGGIILNLMPCVFPVLSMKALHLVSLPAAERAHAQKTGLLYAAGIVVMFLILAGVLFALRAGGQQLGWGYQLQDPPFVAALAWLMFVIGLNLAGVFDLRIAFGGEMLLAEKHHPLVSSFLTGVLATLVATPCSAPFMAAAVGAAMTQTLPVALLIFACVGVGLASPFLLLSYVPALQKFLPRPGAWMETFRQVLAFPMFASAVWLVWVLAQQGGPSAVGWTLAGMVALAFAIWLVDRQPTTRAGRTIVMVAGLAIIVLTISALALVRSIPSDDDMAQSSERISEDFSAEALDHALTDTDAPVFVNMTAAWCITCLVNEKTTLDTPVVHDLFKDKNVTYLKGDWTNKDPGITAFLQHFGRSGVPIYVYYAAPDESGKRPAPQILPQILSVDTITALFE